MSNKLDDLKENGAWSLKKSLKNFLDEYQNATDGINRSALNVEELSDHVILYQVQEKAYEAYMLLEKLYKPVKAEGYLKKQANGRYQVGGVELTSGSYVEYYTEYGYGGYFSPSRVEHNGKDYYIVALGENTPIEGKKVRIK